MIKFLKLLYNYFKNHGGRAVSDLLSPDLFYCAGLTGWVYKIPL